jgi:hypothetical protein
MCRLLLQKSVEMGTGRRGVSLSQLKLPPGQLKGSGISPTSFRFDIICLGGRKLLMLLMELPAAQVESRVVRMFGYFTRQRFDTRMHISMSVQRNGHDPAPDDALHYPSFHRGRVIAEAVLEYAEEPAVFVERSR